MNKKTIAKIEELRESLVDLFQRIKNSNIKLVFDPIGLAVNIVASVILLIVLWHFAFKFSWKELSGQC